MSAIGAHKPCIAGICCMKNADQVKPTSRSPCTDSASPCTKHLSPCTDCVSPCTDCLSPCTDCLFTMPIEAASSRLFALTALRPGRTNACQPLPGVLICCLVCAAAGCGEHRLIWWVRGRRSQQQHSTILVRAGRLVQLIVELGAYLRYTGSGGNDHLGTGQQVETGAQRITSCPIAQQLFFFCCGSCTAASRTAVPLELVPHTHTL